MTTALREAVSPQARYYADTRDIFRELDNLEHDALRRILARVDELRRDVTDRLLSLVTTLNPDGTETWQAWQLRAYQHELEQAAQRWGDRVRADLAQDLQGAADLGKAQMPALSALAQAEGVPAALVSFGVVGVLDQQVATAILHSADYIKAVQQNVIVGVNREIQAVVFGGQSRYDAVQNIRAKLATQPSRTSKAGRKRFGSLTYQAARVEQNELLTVYNRAADFSLQQAADELPTALKEWVTVLDGRADEICRALSGKRVKPNGLFLGGVSAPPIHVGCRCRTVMWMPNWPADPFQVGTPHRVPTVFA